MKGLWPFIWGVTYQSSPFTVKAGNCSSDKDCVFHFQCSSVYFWLVLSAGLSFPSSYKCCSLKWEWMAVELKHNNRRHLCSCNFTYFLPMFFCNCSKMLNNFSIQKPGKYSEGHWDTLKWERAPRALRNVPVLLGSGSPFLFVASTYVNYQSSSRFNVYHPRQEGSVLLSSTLPLLEKCIFSKMSVFVI